MAIDTAAKRNSALDHEEPWQFCAPLPDGTIGQGDRQHSIWSYSGILAGAVAELDIFGPEYTAPANLLHWTAPLHAMHFTAKEYALHYTAEEHDA